MAQSYSWAHPDDPWAVYISAYGEASAFFTVPRDLEEARKKLPEKQAILAKKLMQARQKGLSGKDDYFRTLDQMKQDLSSLVDP
jgi:hypothetical protein